MQDSETELIDENEQYTAIYVEEGISEDEHEPEQMDEVMKNIENIHETDETNYSSDDEEEELEIDTDPTKTILHTTGTHLHQVYPLVSSVSTI